MKVRELLKANEQKIDLITLQSEFGDLICEQTSKDSIIEEHGELDVDGFYFWISPEIGIRLDIICEDTGE